MSSSSSSGMRFEWDEGKRRSNLAKHLIDFADVPRVFQGPVLEKSVVRGGEARVFALGLLEDVAVVVIYTERRGVRRIISARRAHRDERKHLENKIERPN